MAIGVRCYNCGKSTSLQNLLIQRNVPPFLAHRTSILPSLMVSSKAVGAPDGMIHGNFLEQVLHELLRVIHLHVHGCTWLLHHGPWFEGDPCGRAHLISFSGRTVWPLNRDAPMVCAVFRRRKDHVSPRVFRRNVCSWYLRVSI